MQGSPVKLRCKNKRGSLVGTVLKVVFDLALLIAVFYAGYMFGHNVFGGGCPSINAIEQCYVCTNEGIIPTDIFRNITGGLVG